MDTLQDQLKHLRTVHVTLMAICFTALYVSELTRAPSGLASEVRQLRSYADSATLHPEDFLIRHQEQWVATRMDSIPYQLQHEIDRIRDVSSNFNFARWRQLRRNAISVRRDPQQRVGSRTTLQELRSILVSRPVHVQFVRGIGRCEGAFQRIMDGLNGRSFILDSLDAKPWPAMPGLGTIHFVLQDARIPAGYDPEKPQPAGMNDVRVLLTCQSDVREDSLTSVFDELWFEGRFPLLSAVWEKQAPMPSRVAEIRAQAQDREARRNTEISTAGFSIELRFMGLALASIAAALLFYIWACMRNINDFWIGHPLRNWI